jgi:hypothetical protein
MEQRFCLTPDYKPVSTVARVSVFDARYWAPVGANPPGNERWRWLVCC